MCSLCLVGEDPWKLAPGFLQTLPHVPFPFADLICNLSLWYTIAVSATIGWVSWVLAHPRTRGWTWGPHNTLQSPRYLPSGPLRKSCQLLLYTAFTGMEITCNTSPVSKTLRSLRRGLGLLLFSYQPSMISCTEYLWRKEVSKPANNGFKQCFLNCGWWNLFKRLWPMFFKERIK